MNQKDSFISEKISSKRDVRMHIYLYLRMYIIFINMYIPFINILYSSKLWGQKRDEKLPWAQCGGRVTANLHKGIWDTNGTVLYCDCSDDYMTVSICQNRMPEISVRRCSVKVSYMWNAMANFTVISVKTKDYILTWLKCDGNVQI